MKLILPSNVATKLRYYVEAAPGEISGLGKVSVEGQDIIVEDIEIFEQVVSVSHSDLDMDTLGKFLYEKTRAKEDLAAYRLWWHSHHRMEAFFSQTDTGTIDSWNECDWLASLVTNLDGDFVARVDTYRPFRLYKQLDVVITEEDDEALRAEIEAEVADKVSTRASTGTGHKSTPGYKTHGSYGDLPDIPSRDGYPAQDIDREILTTHMAYQSEVEGYPRLAGETYDMYFERLERLVEIYEDDNFIEEVWTPNKKQKRDGKGRR